MDEWTLRFAPELRALVTLAREDGHMTGAATALGVPQSTMSRRIRAFEDALGVPLVVRQGRRVALTPRARVLTDRLEEPLAEIDRALVEAAAETDADHGTVRFGFPLTLGEEPVPGVVAGFRRAFPGVELHLVQEHGASLIERLLTGSLDLALVIPPPTQLPHTVVAQQEIVAVLPDGHRLAGRSEISVEDLVGEPLIVNPPQFHLRALTDELFRSVDEASTIGVEAAEFGTMRRLVALDLGCALLPRRPQPVDGTCEVPISGGPSRAVALAWPSGALSVPARRLRDHVLAVADHV
ncbi:LysR family transcriptional regulator [Brevibacterium jeotgali]|uniref:DNA-binding transcriptional regulator, LysR family n=1 Tax=Brevibacterium jeotgali TaxID=1262550 RepID=A0A2H1L3D4_9MICO|nr:LysR family transcriptional regulator [Brevibacterium jeotgali]TWC02443.1 DNA-binding transcriptional LysR family regulator [Brevibacterium jeotgali]SMY11235.1 DNA-binding transcriptional regulator, LysR family [Brevibacterium jeotgali]